MRTNIDIDDDLMSKAMEITGLSTKKATVEEALREYVRRAEQRDALQKLRGMGGWEGDIKAMRKSRFADKEPW